jgi:serine/threonine protein kinase
VLLIMVMRKVGKYEVGRTIGEGTFAKVKFAQNTETGESVAVKVLDRQTVLKHKMVEQVGFRGLDVRWRYWRKTRNPRLFGCDESDRHLGG